MSNRLTQSPPGSLALTEVWTSPEEHERTRNSPEVEAWAADMPSLVAGPPEVTPLVIEGDLGLKQTD